jgi:hypothetical protein
VLLAAAAVARLASSATETNRPRERAMATSTKLQAGVWDRKEHGCCEPRRMAEVCTMQCRGQRIDM